MNDGELLTAFIEGDEQAFAELYHRWRIDLYRYILSITNVDYDLAHDVYQETFLKMYEHAHTLRDRSNVRGWMFSIARNSCISHFRRRGKQVTISYADETVEDDTRPAPDAALETREMYTALDEAIARLPDTQRDAIILREFKGYSYAEIAALTKTNVGIVRQRLWRAKKALRKILASRFDQRPGT